MDHLGVHGFRWVFVQDFIIVWLMRSIAYTMFNVWLPAVLESRATGEGDEAIKEALSEFVLYSSALSFRASQLR